MTEIFSKKYNYVLKYHAKSGCSYARYIFLELHRNELNKGPSKEHHRLFLDFPYNNEKVKYKINVVRNPYKRVVSMFTDKYIGLNNNLYNKIKLNKDTFYEFVNFLYNTNLTNIKDIHIKKQSLKYHVNDIIIKCENFETDILNFYKKLNEDLYNKCNNIIYNNSKNKKHRMLNKTKRNDTKIYVYDTVYEPGIDRSWPDYKYFYNDEIKNMVYEIYKEDFINFNYDKDSI